VEASGAVPTLYDGVNAVVGDFAHGVSVPVLFQSLAVSVVIVLVIALAVRRDLARAEGGGVIPSERVTLRNIVEVLIGGLAHLMRETIGPKWVKYLPLVGTLGLTILIGNLMGLVPGLGGPTSYIENNFCWAAMAFLVSEYVAVKEQGLGNYIRHMMGPVIWLAPIMIVVEIISHLARLFSLMVRLTGNMFADHTLVAVFLSFGVVQWVAPWIFMGLGLFVAFLQAFIFSFLTTIYIGQAIEGAESHH
jgi:F-type H+-transporting ATPase subunit a